MGADQAPAKTMSNTGSAGFSGSGTRAWGVPRDEEVQEGIRTRKAYGGGATRSAFAVLCELMEAEHGEESPARDRLTIEHVMPQKLTDEWKQVLGRRRRRDTRSPPRQASPT